MPRKKSMSLEESEEREASWVDPSDESTASKETVEALPGRLQLTFSLPKSVTLPAVTVALFVILPFLTLTIGYLYSQNHKLEGALQETKSTGKTNNSGTTAQAAQPSTSAGKVQPVQSSDHILGSKDAPIILIEYSDFECPFCKRFQPSVQQAEKEYGSKIAVVYRHFPLSFHQNAEKEAEASECVNELGGNDAFWKFHDAIYERTTSNGQGFPLANLAPLAGEIGIDQTKFTSCLDSGKYAAHIQADQKSGSESGVSGTPTTFILKKDGTSKPLSGALPYVQIKQAIDAALL
jgi:protein-disulfide isomerase